MAKPTGAIDCSDIGAYWLEDNKTHYLYYAHRIEQAIQHWALGDWSNLFARFKSCVSVDAGNDITIDYKLPGGGSQVEVRAGALVRAWSDDWTPLNRLLEVGAAGLGNPSPHFLSPPLGRTYGMRVTSSKSAAATIHAFMMEIYHGGLTDEEPYDPHLPAGAIDNIGVTVLAEPLDHSGVSPELYAPQMPVSSWLMRSTMCATMNRLAYQARLCFSWPVFRPKPPS